MKKLFNLPLITAVFVWTVIVPLTLLLDFVLLTNDPFGYQNMDRARYFIEDARLEVPERISQANIAVINNSKSKREMTTLFKDIETALDVLPQKIFDTIKNDAPLKIIFYDETDGGIPESIQKLGPIDAFHSRYDDENRIFILKRQISPATSYLRLLFHEIGHAYASASSRALNTNLSPTVFCEAIRNKERPPTEYAKTNESEDFAETFALYFANPLQLKNMRPLRYEELERILR